MRRVVALTRIATVLALLLLAASALTQLDLSSYVQLRIEAYAVNVEGGQERLEEATSARPGQAVEYRVYAVNGSSQELQAGTVVVTVPVPPGTTFVANSARPASDDYLLEFSAPGADFMSPPVLVESGGSRRTANQSEYTAVRWTLLTPMAAGQEEVFSFRVTID